MKSKVQLITRLMEMGFSFEESQQLRRIEMTLHRWAELECGDSNDFQSWAIERNEPVNIELINWPNADGNVWLVENRGDAKQAAYFPLREFQTKDKSDRIAKRELRRSIARNIPGKPYMVHYPHSGKSWRQAIPDREAGALRRLDAILAKHPGLVRYQQTDPRGCALYILRADDVKDAPIDSVYTRGLAVCDNP